MTTINSKYSQWEEIYLVYNMDGLHGEWEVTMIVSSTLGVWEIPYSLEKLTTIVFAT